MNLDLSSVNGYTFSLPTYHPETSLYDLDGHFFFLITGATSTITTRFANDSNGVSDPYVPGSFSTITGAGGQLFAISYNASFSGGTLTGGNDVAVMAIPEPNSLAMLAGSLGMALGLQRFRRRRH